MAISYRVRIRQPQSASAAEGKPIVRDGLFLEGKEIVGGYTEVEVANLDEALAMAKSWPGRGTIEVRPVIQQR